MKKLLSLVFSLTICATGISAMTSSAEISGSTNHAWFVIVNQDIPEYFTLSNKWNDFLGYTSDSEGLIYEQTDSQRLMYITKEFPCYYPEKDTTELVREANEFWCDYGYYSCENGEIAAELADHISEKYPDFIVTTSGSNNCFVTISGDEYKNLSSEEKFSISYAIKEDTGLTPRVYFLQSTINPKSINIAGDTDLDGSVTISDAAQIMSFVTNYEKYPLSEMAQIVGDVYNTGDGINNMDALQIQRMLANID